MRLGLVISTDDAETCWNALRYGNFALDQKDAVKIFLVGKGVAYQKISTDEFNTIAQAERFLKAGGKIYACASCMKSRDQEGSAMCPISTLEDLYEIVSESEKVVTF